MFEAAMLVFLVSTNGPPEKVSEYYYDTMEECLLHKHQKEFTEFATEKGSPMFICIDDLDFV